VSFTQHWLGYSAAEFPINSISYYQSYSTLTEEGSFGNKGLVPAQRGGYCDLWYRKRLEKCVKAEHDNT